MFNELVAATISVINADDFFFFFQVDGYENYFTNRLHSFLFQNGLIEFNPNTAFQGFGGRRFDLRWIENGQRIVCEVGHQHSNNGYLNNIPGLLNKLFSDYKLNYQFEGLAPISYQILYFSLLPNYNLYHTNTMINLIISLLPHKNIARIPIIRNNILKGHILVIDRIENENEVIEIYRNNPNIHLYLRNTPLHWN
jgi:hypothetical protein